MGLFRNPMREPLTTNQIIGIILYFFLAAVSVWATAQSIGKTFDFPPIVSYAIGTAIVLIMAAMLSIMKEAFVERKMIPFIVGLIVFLLVWAISLITNSHSFYIKGSLKNIQEQELKIIKNELEGLQVNSFSLINEVIIDTREDVTGAISSYKREVVEGNPCGDGPLADSLKRIVEVKLNHTFYVPPYEYGNMKKCLKNANKTGAEMSGILKTRIKSIETEKESIDNMINNEESKKLLSEVSLSLNSIFDGSIKDNRKVISNAYNYYNGIEDKVIAKLQPIVERGIIEEHFNNDNIPDIPGSIQLEHISNTYQYIKDKGAFNKSEFLFSFLMALAIDLGAIAIFYFSILKGQDEY